MTWISQLCISLSKILLGITFDLSALDLTIHQSKITMGREKEEWMATNDRGYSILTKLVCIDCILDKDLKNLHSEHSEKGLCDYCGKSDLQTAPAEFIQKRIMSCLLTEYDDIEQADAPYSTRDGGYQVAHEDAKDIVGENLWGAVSEEFLEAVVDAIQDVAWCSKDWMILSPSDRLHHGWQEFCDTVKHRLRFTFFEDQGSEEIDHPDHTSPYLTLAGIRQLVNDYELVKKVKAGTKIKRVRVDGSEVYSSKDDLGTPPHQHASANRMSPAGIPMFYGAHDTQTAISETWDGENESECSIATFELKQDIKVIDLENLPKIPGFWSMPGRSELAALGFLHNLADDMSKPVERGSKVDLHYAPTQIVSEFLTKSQNDPTQSSPLIYGLIFKSSKTQQRIYALNIYHKKDKSLGVIMDDLFKLVKSKHKTLTVK